MEFRQPEVDAYVQHELAPLFPKGLEQVNIQLQQGLIAGSARINFDTLETGDGKSNPLLSALLRGQHLLGRGGKRQDTKRHRQLRGVEGVCWISARSQSRLSIC